uniref:Spermatogenesis-associated protein 21-like n=1 Tax=Ciona intestinalis TaxID=7719 RepID=A0A1W5BQH4_CIOIN|nr:spermatogenesis-associated protein 21-like [Ciona intestinalis]|eukprot:XP_002128846.1 spermatogenesis-associated protein 21-like [Ciona intestinalis]
MDLVPGKTKVRKQASVCKNHTVDVFSSRPQTKQVKFPQIEKNGANGKPEMTLDPTRLSSASKLLTKKQQCAFFEAFEFFDHRRNGRISSEEFVETLRRVGVPVNEKVVYDLIVAQDENGNGEMDFEEYLNFMTNEDIFMSLIGGNQEPGKPDDKDVLMYQVMSKFIKRSELSESQRMEIVGYYTRKLRKAAKKHILMHAAHVVHHYANGARSLGLTEKEIFNQIETIKQLAQNEGDEKKKNSPYAHPIQLILTPISITKSNRNKLTQPGWNTPQISAYGVRLPRINVSESKTFENVHDIRKKVETVKEDYYWDLSKAQRKNFNSLLKDLHIRNIPTNRLQTMMKGIFDVYTASRLTGCRGRHGVTAKTNSGKKDFYSSRSHLKAPHNSTTQSSKPRFVSAGI